MKILNTPTYKFLMEKIKCRFLVDEIIKDNKLKINNNLFKEIYYDNNKYKINNNLFKCIFYDSKLKQMNNFLFKDIYYDGKLSLCNVEYIWDKIEVKRFAEAKYNGDMRGYYVNEYKWFLNHK